MVENGFRIRGMYHDILIRQDGSIIFDSGWHSNTIVRRCRLLLAGFMKNDSANGIQYLQVGQGDANWGSNPPATDPVATQQLVSACADPPITVLPNSPVPGKQYLEMLYLDDSGNPAGAGVITNVIQVKAILVPGYPAPTEFNTYYPLREFGLFGRFGANNYMINCVRHPVIYKDKSATLVREIKLTF